MSRKHAINKIRPQVREEATEWFVAFCEGEVGPSGRESFDQWLRTSPEHVRAYLQISGFWDSVGRLAENTDVDIEGLAKPVVSGLTPSTDEFLPTIPSSGTAYSRRATLSRGWKALAASLLLVSASAAWTAWWQLGRASTFGTGPAELRTVRLPDGSTAQLDARSQIKVHFTTEERAVELAEGQALFSVIHNPRRPFVVRSGATRVRAVGTRFDVYRKDDGTVVTVLEGQVAIRVEGLRANGWHAEVRSPAASALVSAGDQVIASPGTAMHPSHTNLFAATAWTEGKLVFDTTPMRDVVAEFNRVGLRRLSIEDESLLDHHISGVFPATDPSSLVLFLQERFGVTVTETDDKVRIRGTTHK